MQDLISILTPVYNTDIKYFSKYIESVKSQTYINWELCIVDDGSTNNELKTFLDNLSQDIEYKNKIIIKHLPSNQGISEATMEAFKLSSGDYIAFADSDDILHKNALLQTLSLMKK